MKQTAYFSDDKSEHLNFEKVIRYYLSFLPPRDCESILNAGCGVFDVYGGMLRNRTKRYVTVDIRKSPRVDIVADISRKLPFKDEEFEWVWCTDVIEHIEPELKDKAVKEIMRVCKNCVFIYPTPGLYSTDKNVVIKSFYDDPGHTEVKIDWKKMFNKTHNIVDKSTKNGRAIFILRKKGYEDPIPEIKKVRGYF